MDIRRIVKSLTKKHGTNNPFEICSCKDIEIYYVPLGSLNGFYTENFRIKTIYINEKLNERQRKIVCSHELGHIMLKHKENKLFLSNNTFLITNRYEIQADRFAAELLISDELLEELKYYTVDQMAMALGLPVALVKLRLGLI